MHRRIDRTIRKAVSKNCDRPKAPLQKVDRLISSGGGLAEFAGVFAGNGVIFLILPFMTKIQNGKQLFEL